MAIFCEFCGSATEYLTASQAGDLLGRPEQTVRRWIREGRLKAEVVKVYNQKVYRIPKEQVLILLSHYGRGEM